MCIEVSTALPLSARPGAPFAKLSCPRTSSCSRRRSTASVRSVMWWMSVAGFGPETSTLPSSRTCMSAPFSDCVAVTFASAQIRPTSTGRAFLNSASATKSSGLGSVRRARVASSEAASSARCATWPSPGTSTNGSNARFASGIWL